MNGYDVEAHVEFEIKRLKEELPSYNYDFDEYKRCNDQLIDALELRIQQLKYKIQVAQAFGFCT